MHVVTKILIVAASILCVLLSALTMAYAVNADRIVADLNSEKNLKDAAMSARTNDVAAAKEELDRKSGLVESLSTQLAARDTNIRQLQNERSDLVTSIRKAEAERDSISSKIEQMAATTNTQAKLVDTLIGEVTKLRDNELAYRREAIQLTDRINDLDSQRAGLEQSVRALQEQMTELRYALQNASAGVTAGANAPRPPTVKAEGRITQTMADAVRGVMLAQIDLGTNDQVRENTLLYIIRAPSEYIGQIVIEKADLKTAVGRINLQGQTNVQVRAGDLVRGSLR
ncbi:MAG: hypothetical protein ACKVU4_10540 [Phycisphaerales bacterium]